MAMHPFFISRKQVYFPFDRIKEMCLLLAHQNPSKTSEKMGYFVLVSHRVTVSLYILYTANQETEGSQDRLTV